MTGGFNRWKDEGLPWEAPGVLTPDQRNRYQRHLLLPEVDVAGQIKLLALQGAPARRRRPGLSCGPLPGGGRRGHARRSSTWTWSTPPTCSARSSTTWTGWASARSIRPRRPSPPSTPMSTWSTYDVRLGADNIMDIFAGYDLIVDGTDNFPTRYLVNDASLEARHPRGARLDLPLRGPGQRLPAPPRALLPLPGARAAPGRPGAVVRRGRRAGRAPGIIGSLQAMEAIKVLLGLGEPARRAASWPTTPWRAPSAPSSSTVTPTARPARSPRSSW